METKEQVKRKKSDFIGTYEATGLLGMGGFLFFYVGCIFLVDDIENPTLRFHGDGIGDDFDGETSEMEGSFSKSPAELADIGECTYSLETAEFEEGAIELTIMQNGEVVGVFLGDSEGIGEAVLVDKKGKLTIPSTKEHDNQLIFEGDDTIQSITFDYGDLYSISDGQPWGEVETTSSKDGSKLTIDIGAGRHKTAPPATWYNEVVGSDGDKMFHSQGGDNVPSVLNFAIKGVLTINQDKFNVCLGQGQDGSYNNWHLASDKVSASHPHKSGDLGNYHLTPSGSYKFKVKVI
ncbi:MAG: hypothetical protein JKY54_17685 [Flavobacteriales bacterium]|nr:hypothetical protein [Flavobacteriales bacterium]